MLYSRTLHNPVIVYENVLYELLFMLVVCVVVHHNFLLEFCLSADISLNQIHNNMLTINSSAIL